MARLSRRELQRRNRDRVLRAARREFAERGYQGARVDDIAERAELTRGAVYSNFPGKRALYLAALAEAAGLEPPEPAETVGSAATPAEALGSFARIRLSAMPLATEAGTGSLGPAGELLPLILEDARLRAAYSQLMTVSAMLLGLALERRAGSADRLVRASGAVLTLLHGAAELSVAAPGFVEPFSITRACERLAAAQFDDRWRTGAFLIRPEAMDQPAPEIRGTDLVRGRPAALPADGVIAVLGLNRLEAVEEAVRAAPAGDGITCLIATGDPGELAPLAKLVLSETASGIRRSFPPECWPPLQVIADPAAAAGLVPDADDSTETSFVIHRGRMVARTSGRGACHVAATELRHLAKTGRHRA